MTGEEGYTVTGQNRYTVDYWSRRHAGQVAFFLGLFVGAGSAILLTSMSGKEARGKLFETSKTLTDQVGSCYSTARDAVTETLERGRNWFRESGPCLAAAIHSGIEAYAAEKRRVAEEITQASD